MTQNRKIGIGSWISFMSNKVKSGGGINLAQGIPGFKPPADLLDILEEMSHDEVHQYPSGNGQPKLVNLICESYSDFGTIKPEEVLIVQGATEGISLVFIYLVNLFGSGWSSMAFDPVYESYNELPGIFNCDLIKIPLADGGQIDRVLVEKKLSENQVRLIFVNSPGNPLGKVWTKDEFDWLLALSDKYGFYILLDAVYKDLFFGEKKPFLPLAEKKDKLFYVNSFSKMLSITGWRVGYIIAHREAMEKIRAIHDYTGLCAPSILQYAISDYLEKSEYAADYIREIRGKLNDNFKFFKSNLEELGFIVEHAEGGYFIWCKLPDGPLDGKGFALQLYDSHKVGLVPGIHFSERAKNWIRINIARERDELRLALESIREFVAELSQS